MLRSIVAKRKVDEQNTEMPMYTALIIGAVFTVVLGVPDVVWLTKLIRPPKPEEEAIHRGVEEARRPVRTHPQEVQNVHGTSSTLCVVRRGRDSDRSADGDVVRET